jgi:hypothetical protein
MAGQVASLSSPSTQALLRDEYARPKSGKPAKRRKKKKRGHAKRSRPIVDAMTRGRGHSLDPHPEDRDDGY